MNLLATIIEDYRTHREGVFSQGFWALLVYRLSRPRVKCRIPVVRQLWFLLNIIGRKFIEIITGISLPEGVCIGRRLRIEHYGSIIVHSNAKIGNDCVLRQGVTLGNRTEEEPNCAPTLCNGVIVGAGAKILGNITIGQNTIIGANAVVISGTPSGSICVGIPAKVRIQSPD